MRLSLLVAVVLAAVGPAPPAASAAAVPRFGHVFLIVGENTSYAQVSPGRAPFVARTLRRRGAWLTGYRTFAHSKSLGQYIAMVSGQYNGCEAANAFPDTCRQSVPSLLSQLDAAGRAWRVWSQSMPAPCTSTNAGSYIAHHNPALYFSRISSSCTAGSVPMGGTGAKDTSGFDAALARGDVGDFNLVVPNNCENGHDACGG